MRAQYHFRRSERGLLAWDVHRLVRLSRGLPQEFVPLSEIRELDESFWSDDGPRMTCRQVVEHAQLMRECDLAFPVILSSDGRVMDGMHRVCKALLLGRETIAAVRFGEDPEPDYVNVDPDDLPYVDSRFSIADAFPIVAAAVPEFPPRPEDWEDQLSYIYINDLVRFVCDRAYPGFEPVFRQFGALIERLYTEGDESVHDLAHEALETVWDHRDPEVREFVARYFGPKTTASWQRICGGEHRQ